QDIHDADETRNKFIERLFIDLARRPDLFQSSAREYDDAVGHFQGFLLVVRDKNSRDVQFLMQPDEPFPKFLADFGIHGPKRLIQQKDTWLGSEGTRNGDALPLAARELVRITPLQTFQPEELHQLGHARFELCAFPFFDLQPKRNVLEHIHALEQRVILEDKADVSLLDGQIIDALAANENVTGGGQFQTCYHAQHGSLSTATRPQQGHQLALFHGKGDVIDGGSFAEAFCDLFQ